MQPLVAMTKGDRQVNRTKETPEDVGISRRGALDPWSGRAQECVDDFRWRPKSVGLIGDAAAAGSGFTFLQISDSHIGFNKLANPHALGTLREAIGKIEAVVTNPPS